MKLLINIFIFSVLSVCVSSAQSPQSTTFLKELTHLSASLHLELSFSSDLVNLNDSTDFVFSSQADSCMVQIESMAGLKLTKKEGHLVVLPAPPKIIRMQGVVMDSETKELLPYASMQIKNTSAGTTTNSEGKFDLKVVAKYIGYEIELSYLCYSSVILKIPGKLH